MVGSMGNDNKMPSQHIAALQSLMTEVHGARWADQNGQEDQDIEVDPEEADDAGNAAPHAATSPPASLAKGHCEVNLTAGLVCMHGLICRPRSGCLVRRAAIEQLLKICSAKEEAYMRLWPKARAVPRL